MISRLRRLATEPLVHFLLIGAAIFGFHEFRAGPDRPEAAGQIVISGGDIQQMRLQWEKRWLRPPTEEELDRLIDESVREEVLYREALALGLDRDDAVIRRLLRQKFEFVTQDLAVPPEPDESALAAYYEANRLRYTAEPRVSFSQIYFNTDRRGAAGQQDALLALASLRAGRADSASLGDGRVLAPAFRDTTTAEISALFGEAFSDAIAVLEPGEWSGPIESGYGLHLVRLDGRTPAMQLPFDEVRDRVRADLTDDLRQDVNEAIFRQLLSRYDVVVERDDGTRP